MPESSPSPPADRPRPTDDPTENGLVVRYFWSRHANPVSVWSLFALFPALVLSLYRRSPRLFVGTLLFVVASVLGVDPPEDDAAWATRVVLGERVWLDRGLTAEPVELVVLLAAAPVPVYTLRSALARRPVRTACGTVLTLLVSLGFFQRMVRLYEHERAATADHRD